MVKSPQRKGIVTLQDVANALLYFEGGSLAKELRRAGLDMTPSAFIQRRHQLNSGVFQDVLAAFGAPECCTNVFAFGSLAMLTLDPSTAQTRYP